MAAPNIPAAKRAGLPIDLDRLTTEGDGWLTPEDRYALKTYGVCTQGQPGVFMVRVRVPGGVLLTSQAHGLARLARRFGPDWLHLTTRQSIEFHWVPAAQVQELLAGIERLGLSTRSACGHTLRNVLCSEDAGLGLDEPFDCFADARMLSESIVARSAQLNVTLPSRVNVSVGGSPRCVEDARINDVGLISTIIDGVAGYELWVGGSLGKAPQIGVRIAEFVPREQIAAAVDAVIEVFVAEGDLEHPAKGRLKFVVDRLGIDEFRRHWLTALDRTSHLPRPALTPIERLEEADRVAILSVVPAGGWSTGVRPQRTPGRALVSVDVPLGDTCASEFELLANLADLHGDGALMVTRDQNVTLRNVPVPDVAAVRARVAGRGLHLVGESDAASIRACTGSDVCAIGITDSPDAGRRLAERPSLRRNGALRVHVSGCPNSCAQHQAGDIGLAGSKVRIGGRTTDGYHLFVGAQVAEGLIGQAIGRVAEADLARAVDALIGLWEAVRQPDESLGATVRRIGLDALAAHLAVVLAERWAVGPEPELADATSPSARLAAS
jgi:sulfite reductase beta subunit-like hemoprotein